MAQGIEGAALPASVQDDIDNSSPIVDAEYERLKKMNDDAFLAHRASVERKRALIDGMFEKRIIKMSAKEAMGEARRRLGINAFIHRSKDPREYNRCVIGVRIETNGCVRLLAAGAGHTWEQAFDIQAENEAEAQAEKERRHTLLNKVAEVCHEALRAYNKGFDPNLPVGAHWEELSQDARDSSMKGVAYRLDNPDASAEDQHNRWLQDMAASGWKYGLTKDDEKKEHPYMVPFSELSPDVRKKDLIFAAVVMAVAIWDANGPQEKPESEPEPTPPEEPAPETAQ